MRILIIEDNVQISQALEGALKAYYSIDVAFTGSDAIKKMHSSTYTIVILDLHLPDMSGLQICRELRSLRPSLPILILTGDEKVHTKISLLDAGADDYLTKPFSLGELRARLRALVRRQVNGSAPTYTLVVGDLIMDTSQHRVQRSGTEINLRRKEFSLLECLMKHAGTVVTREVLTNYAWNETEETWTNTVDVHIKYLRDKVDRSFEEKMIKTVHGLGYKLEVSKSATHIKHERSTV